VTAKERLDKHDREIAAIRKLVQTGMKMIVRIEALQMETRKDLRELAAAQKRTAKDLQALINSLRAGRNGHGIQG
jgi:hypothetical protein